MICYSLSISKTTFDRQVKEYFEESGADISGMSEEEILSAEEVFVVGDGRYLIVEA